MRTVSPSPKAEAVPAHRRLDLAKDTRTLISACDAARIIAAFNLNLHATINRELGGNFNLSAFEHMALQRKRLGSSLAQQPRQFGDDLSGVSGFDAAGSSVDADLASRAGTG